MPSSRFSIESISSRLSGDKPLPRPPYYTKMNNEEAYIHSIIGEQKYEYVLNKKGKMKKKWLSPSERLQRQRMFFDSRVGHAILGDEWMRMKLPTRQC